MNSDSEQCTESKLGWVHRVHTQRTLVARMVRPGRARTTPRPLSHCTVWWRAGCRIAGPAPAVSQALSAVLWLVAGRVVGLNSDTPSTKVMRASRVTRPLRRIVTPSRPCRSIVSRHSQLPSLPLSRYHRLYRDTLPSVQAMCARCRTPARVAGRVVDCIVAQPAVLCPLLVVLWCC